MAYVYDGASRLLELDLDDFGKVVRQYMHDPGTGQILAVDQNVDATAETKDLWAFHDLQGNVATVATE